MTNEELYELLEARARAPGPLLPNIKDFRIDPNPPGRHELLARIEVLEMRMNSQEARLSTLVLRVAARERQAKILKAQASGGDVVVHLMKTMSFRLSFTVAELASHFGVDPGVIEANLPEYAAERANSIPLDCLMHTAKVLTESTRIDAK